MDENETAFSEISTEIHIVVLAAGQSQRMGTPKMALYLGEETVLQKTVNNVCKSLAENITVVLNEEYSFLESHLKMFPINIVWNSNAKKGMSSSLKIGLSNIFDSADNMMIVLADQPGIPSTLIDDLMKSHIKENAMITQPKYKNSVGHPVIFNKKLFNELLKVEGDQGGREVIRKYREYRQLINVDYEQPEDLDTKNDYLKYLRTEVMINE